MRVKYYFRKNEIDFYKWCRIIPRCQYIVKSFSYYFSINELYDETFPFEQRGDTLVEIKMEHDPSAQGYHKHEIIFEQYTENEYRELLVNLLHSYFDVYKENAIKFLKT